LLGEILPPAIEQTGIEHSDVDARPVEIDRAAAEAGVGRHVDRVIVPSADSIGKISRRHSIDWAAFAFRVRIRRGDIRAAANGRQLRRGGPHRDQFDRGRRLENSAVATEVVEILLSDRALKKNVDADGGFSVGGESSEEQQRGGRDEGEEFGEDFHR
jgi:hypothetical protein